MKKAFRAVVVILGAVVSTLAVVGLFQRPDTTLPPGAPGRHVVVDGTLLRTAQFGQGRDVLLVHGSPGSVDDWEPLIARLSSHFHVTAYDRHGHGYSGGAERPHTPAENAHMALALIHALGLKDVVYVGHSYGGTTGLALATQHPPEISAYVLVGARAYPPVNVDTLFRVLDVPLVGPGFAAVVSRFIGPGRVESGVRASFGPNAGMIPAGFIAPRAALWGRPTIATSLAQERTTLTRALLDMGPRYPAIRPPVFLVCGDHDHPNFEQAQRLVREIPGARLTALAETGHYVQFARTEALAAVIEEAATTPPR
jgi:pimeloyl-ACP methyl ester carboxylesterase